MNTIIWAGSLISNGTSGVLNTAKTVYGNASFVDKVAATSYRSNAGVITTGTLVQYKSPTGADLQNLIFTTALATLRTRINTQPTTNKTPLNAVALTIIPAGGPNYSLTVDAGAIWWIEDAATNQAYVTLWDSTLSQSVVYKVSITGGAAALQTLINN
jgi:hypothetical protein